MTDATSALTIFVAHPLLAAVPAVTFITAHVIRPRRSVLVAGVAWIAYTIWELAIKRYFVCAVPCRIRVDLLLIYPGLAAASITAIVALVQTRRTD